MTPGDPRTAPIVGVGRRTVAPPGVARAAMLFMVALGSPCCAITPPDPRDGGSAAVRLRPLTTTVPEPSWRRTVYVPIYSSIYAGMARPHPPAELTATLSVRNLSQSHRLIVNSVRYYDSDGRHVRDYISAPGELPPLGSVEFVVARMDTVGGPGANFLVECAGVTGMDEPLIEAVMTGQLGNAGISFTAAGRVLTEPASTGRRDQGQGPPAAIQP